MRTIITVKIGRNIYYTTYCYVLLQAIHDIIDIQDLIFSKYISNATLVTIIACQISVPENLAFCPVF